MQPLSPCNCNYVTEREYAWSDISTFHQRFATRKALEKSLFDLSAIGNLFLMLLHGLSHGGGDVIGATGRVSGQA